TLGAGKSVFARAFIKKMTGAEDVPSPTFTLVQMYDAGAFDIFHYDLYRLKSPMEIFELGVDEAFFSAVSLVEWPEKMGSFAPRDMWHIEISVEDDVRKIKIIATTDEKMNRFQNVR
ncbi:MAG: tRNA (adenosine(37)-N6)-threonylcarbamoyltransferase complex ATPase subunit type 1 TsaE, partial [Alphaproteobacteria bacterium]|nr:tRNA (adenosine(37)-N6)-threonylcarbamoyltransferase complex ATPase subunit type 1 TsaE [Alphaproteobacteria bacterium]